MGKKKEVSEAEKLLQEHPEAIFQESKNLHWHSTLGKISISERTFILGGKLVRPFSYSANIHCRGYSQLLQRRITDFGSGASFGDAAIKLTEHYGITVPESSIRTITQAHGENLLATAANVETSEEPGIKQAVVQTDGCMLPKVEFDPEKGGDLRKTRTVGWKETRLSLAYEPGMEKPVFEATTGGPSEVGEQLRICATNIGYGTQTQIHGVGDGAPWIANQIDLTFGANSSYLIDFYHLCEYLSSASKVCSDDPVMWYDEKKALMKQGKVNNVLEALLPYMEPPSVLDEQAPVRRCFRYIKNRPEQFNYPEAIEKDLPIGSGKIESAHGYVIQDRMKIPGAWWKVENIDKMLALLTCRENGKWEEYWDNTLEAA